MKKTRSKIIIKTRKGGYTKIYANGKWQKGVYNIDFHADCTPLRYPYIKISCEFDKYKTDKNGSVIYNPEKEEIAKEHVVARILGRYCENIRNLYYNCFVESIADID